jgi:hypothetical protein
LGNYQKVFFFGNLKTKFYFFNGITCGDPKMLPFANRKSATRIRAAFLASLRNLKTSFSFLRETKNPATLVAGLSACSDRGGIQTPNPQSRNLMRYSVAPRGLTNSRPQVYLGRNLVNQYSRLTQFIFNNTRNGFPICLAGEFFTGHSHHFAHILHARGTGFGNDGRNHFCYFFFTQLLG